MVGLFGLTALFISLATVSSMISFGALAAFSFVNLSVIKTYIVDQGRRTGADIFKYGVLPFIGWRSRSTCGPSCPGSRSRSGSAGWRPGSSRCS